MLSREGGRESVRDNESVGERERERERESKGERKSTKVTPMSIQ